MRRGRQRGGERKRPAPAPAALAASAPLATDTVLSEIHAMRSVIEEGLASVLWSEQQRRDPVGGRLLRTLLAAGFSARLAQALLARLPAAQSCAQGLAFVRSELARAVPAAPDEEQLMADGGVYALVGPTGVGKTTTTAKLAARCVMRFGPQRLALVTTDGYRIGAYEQLRIYGQILGVPVHAVRDAAGLQQLLAQLHDKHMVLIDTVGMSQRDRAVAEQVAMLCGAGRPVRRLLLLNAASHGDTLNEVVYAYQRAGQGEARAGCIFTKLDEAVSQGALLDTAIRHRLPVHYVSNGQQVPEDLMLAGREQLVELALRPPPSAALFVPVPPQDAVPAQEAAEQLARARQDSDRLRQRYRQLIRAMAHDAQEVAAAARALEAASIGFQEARELWRAAADGARSPEQLQEQLLATARAQARQAGAQHVLALAGRARFEPGEDLQGLELEGALLLSDRDGAPFAAPNQWLAATGSARGAERALQWLARQDFGAPLVHLLARLPAAETLAGYEAQGQSWLARATGTTQVVDPRSGERLSLARLPVVDAPVQRLAFRGRAALCSEAELPVLLVPAQGSALALRCIVRRTVDAASGKPLQQLYLLSNVDAAVSPATLARWHAWSAEAEPCLRLASRGPALQGDAGEPGHPLMKKRLLAGGQAATTAWRLLHAQGERAQRTRLLLGELAGRPVRPGRPQPAAALYEGLAKLLHLLEALEGADAGEEFAA